MNKQMTRDEIQRSESNGGRMPARFTGVWKGVHYYMGEVWTGPTNAIGHGKRLAREGKRIGPTNGNGDRHDRSPQKRLKV